jgi:uncharacterized protein YhaN
VDTELAKFEDDPGIQAKRVAAEIITAEEQARKAKEDLVRAETRIQGLVERRPYASVTEASERLAVLTEQLEREQRRMNALALLHRTFEEARAQMMTEVAAPVQRIATEYLEQICGCPIASIRLSETLAAEQVMPAALTDTGEPPVDLDRVSGGEREQIFFSTRLALGTQLARRERQLVVLDDVLTSTDDERLDRICQLLTSVSERLQIVILTCHPERFANLLGANRIDLLAAMGRNGKVAA